MTQRLFEDQPSHSGTYANLASLEINIDGEKIDTNDDYFHKFKYVPALKSLKLKNIYAELHQLDVLHGCLPYLKSGNINSVFDTLDQCHCDISYLKLGFFPWRIIKMQAQRIETLVLSFTGKVKLDEFDWLKQLGRLKKLKLICFNKRKLKLKLNTLIDNAPPTLKTLSLVDLTISIYTRYKGSTRIETLSLSSVKVPHNIGPFYLVIFLRRPN